MPYNQLIPIMHNYATAYDAVAALMDGDPLLTELYQYPLEPEPPEIDGVPGSRKVMTEASYKRRHLIALAIVMIIWIAASFQPAN